MSDNICPVVRLSAPKEIAGADRLELYEIPGSGPCVTAKGQFKKGDLACFIPPESMVDSSLTVFDFMKKYARKSDGWAKVHPMRLRGQQSIGLLMDPPLLSIAGSNGAAFYGVKKAEDFRPKPNAALRQACQWATAPWYVKAWWRVSGTGPKIPNAPYPGIPVYDVSQLYKMRDDLFDNDTLMIATEKLHGTNARYVVDKSGKFRVGSRTRWLEDRDQMKEASLKGARWKSQMNMTVWHDAAISGDLELKLRRLAEPLVLWGEIVGPGVQKGFDYGVKEPTFFAFDFYHCTERRFLSQSETYNLCRWLEIKHVPINTIEKWSLMSPVVVTLAKMASCLTKDHPSEGIVVRPFLVNGTANDLNGNRNHQAGKVINPAYLELRHKLDPEDEGDDGIESVGGPV